MTQHEELVDRLRNHALCRDDNAAAIEAADALQAQALEIEGLNEMNDQLREQNTAVDIACSELEREIEGLRKDAGRWKFVESGYSGVTLRLHGLRIDQRAEYVDAAIAAKGRSDA